jgi:hypothetical protein
MFLLLEMQNKTTEFIPPRCIFGAQINQGEIIVDSETK